MPTLALSDFQGGYNPQNDPLDLAINESPNLKNMVPVGVRGAIAARRGDVAVAGGIMPVVPGHIQFTPSTANPLLAITFGSVLVADAAHGEIWEVQGSFIRSSLRAASFPATKYFALVDAPVSGGQGPIYGHANGLGAPNAIQIPLAGGAGLGPAAAWTASVGVLPIGRFLLWAGTRLWAFNNLAANEGSAYYWSELGDPRNWPAANVNKLDPGDGDHISAVAVIGSEIIVFKQHKAWSIYDLDTGANRALQFGAGCVDRVDETGRGWVNLAVTTPRGVVFIDPDQGLLITDGSSVKPLDPRRRVDPLLLSAAVSVTTSDDSIFYGLANGDVYEFDLIRDVWWRHDGGGLLTTASTVASLNIAGGTAANIYRTKYGVAANLDVFQGAAAAATPLYSDGTPLALPYATPWLTGGSPARRKRFGPAFVRGAAPAAINATVRHDVNPATWGTRSLPFTGAASEKVRANSLGVTEALQLQLDGATLLEGIEIDYAVRGR